MNILNEKPPIYDEAVKLFKLGENPRVLFTYGDVVYNPEGIEIPAHLIVHETMHTEQQQHDRTVAAIWWKRYFADEEFRREQEIEAYGEQYKFICQSIRDRNMRDKYLRELASQLSSEMYGNIISHKDAMMRINNYASGKDLEGIEDHIHDDASPDSG